MKKILIADDSVTLRAILKHELEQNPSYTVSESSSAEETLNRIKKLQPDLVTMGVSLPDMDGYQLCSAIRKLDGDLAKIPVIFISSNDTLESRQLGHRVGGNDFILKPFAPGELHAAVEKQLNKKQMLQGSKILIVDDSPLIQQILTRYLGEESIDILKAGSGEEALKILRDHINEIDAVLTDYNMAGINGVDLCRAIRNDLGDREIPIIFVTSKREVVEELFQAGATDYLQKPFSKDELLAKVRLNVNPMMVRKNLYQNLIEAKKLTRELERKNDLLEMAQRTILEKTREITQDLRVAGLFQKNYLGDAEIPEFLKLVLYYQPMTHVSGDFYLIRKSNDNECNILLADVAGHGIAAALVSMVAKTLLDKIISMNSVKEIMLNLNDSIEKMIPSESYFTAALLRITRDGKLTIANAGHPGIILIPADGSATRIMKPEGTPVGMFDNSMAFFAEQNEQLNKGDKLVVFTDGLIEQKNNSGEAYGMERFNRSLQRCRNASPEQMGSCILDSFKSFCEDVRIGDDQTLIIAEYL